MKHHFISSLLLATILSVNINSFAESTTLQLPNVTLGINEPQIGAVIFPIKKTQSAPFTGLLLSPAASADIIVRIQNTQNEINLQVKKASDTQKVFDQLTIDNLNSQIEFVKTTTSTIIKNRDDEIVKLTKKIFDDEKNKANLPLWVGVGTVGGIFTTILTVFVVNLVSK